MIRRCRHEQAVIRSSFNWIVDPDRETLSVYRFTVDGYLLALMAEPGEMVRAEPFGDVELDVGALFGDEAG